MSAEGRVLMLVGDEPKETTLNVVLNFDEYLKQQVPIEQIREQPRIGS